MTYAKKSAFFQKPLFLGKANLKGSLETQGRYIIRGQLTKTYVSFHPPHTRFLLPALAYHQTLYPVLVRTTGKHLSTLHSLQALQLSSVAASSLHPAGSPFDHL